MEKDIYNHLVLTNRQEFANFFNNMVVRNLGILEKLESVENTLKEIKNILKMNISSSRKEVEIYNLVKEI